MTPTSPDPSLLWAAVAGGLLGLYARGPGGALLGLVAGPVAMLAWDALDGVASAPLVSSVPPRPPQATLGTPAPRADANGLPLPAESLASFLDHGSL